MSTTTSTTAEISIGGYVARIISDYGAARGEGTYPDGIRYVRERRNGSGTIVTLALDASGAAIVRNILTARVNGDVGDHTKDQRRQFARVIEQLPVPEVFAEAPAPEAPAPAPVAPPVIEATIEAEIEPVATEVITPMIDAALVALRVRTTLRMFWNRIPSLRDADFDTIATAVADAIIASAAVRCDIQTCLVSLADDDRYYSGMFDAAVIRTARDLSEPRTPARKQARPRTPKATTTLDASAKADAAEARFTAALATDPKARNIAALKAVATRLRRVASTTPTDIAPTVFVWPSL